MSQESTGKIDLHLHSNASDGGFPPEDVVNRFALEGYGVIALTDHDTMDGCSAAETAGHEAGIRVITGCEFSVGAPWGELHLLGYFLPLDSAPLDALLRDQQQMRLERAQAMVERLESIGVTVDVEAVLRKAMGGAVGRPHVARVLVDCGIVPDIDAAFRVYLGPRQPAFVPKTLPPVEEVADLVRMLGGVTSAAHLRSRVTRPTLEAMVAAGVDAVEVIHPAHNDAIMAKASALAKHVGLLMSGGSDWHGLRKECDEGRPVEMPEVPRSWLEDLEKLHRERSSALRAR